MPFYGPPAVRYFSRRSRSYLEIIELKKEKSPLRLCALRTKPPPSGRSGRHKKYVGVVNSQIREKGESKRVISLRKNSIFPFFHIKNGQNHY